MDLRNVIFAIALSLAVLFGWSVIFYSPQIEEQKKTESNQNYNKCNAKALTYKTNNHIFLYINYIPTP